MQNSCDDWARPGGSVKAEGLGDGRVEGVPPLNRGQDAHDTRSHRQAALDAATPILMRQRERL